MKLAQRLRKIGIEPEGYIRIKIAVVGQGRNLSKEVKHIINLNPILTEEASMEGINQKLMGCVDTSLPEFRIFKGAHISWD